MDRDARRNRNPRVLPTGAVASNRGPIKKYLDFVISSTLAMQRRTADIAAGIVAGVESVSRGDL